MTESTLGILWYLVIIACLLCYTVLDGFDLGVGSLHLFTKKDEHRRIFLNAIGPVWDGNEVWLVVIIGALFAGFPEVYATLLSSFYLPIMAFLLVLIFRAVAIEFRSKHTSYKWRQTWDTAFCVASILIGFFAGVILGNLVEGIPLDENKNFIGTLSGFFRPYSMVIGVTAIALFAMHGSLFLLMKTEGALHKQLKGWVNKCILFFIVCYAATTILTFVYMPHMIERMKNQPYLFLVGLVGLLAILNIPRQVSKKNDGTAFLFSCLGIAILLSLFAIGTYPVMIRSTISPETNSVTIAYAASSPLTLKVLLIIVLIGIPMVLAYGYYVYRVFRGKVTIGDHSY